MAADKIWAEIPVQFQDKILSNVYCSHCRDSVKIVDYSGSVVSGDLLLKGHYEICGHEVSRLVESS